MKPPWGDVWWPVLIQFLILTEIADWFMKEKGKKLEQIYLMEKINLFSGNLQPVVAMLTEASDCSFME